MEFFWTHQSALILDRVADRVVKSPIGEAGDISIGDLQMKGMKLAT
jgi:hypothetical protein